MRKKMVAFVLSVMVAVGLAGTAVYIAIERTNDRSDENRLLFKFACALPLAVAERLDVLVQASAQNPGHTEDAQRKFKKYHRDFQRGKDICPPLSPEESTQLRDILIDLGGKPPDSQPGR